MLPQHTLIETTRQAGERTASVEAVLMYGSFTQGCGDIYSDVEFYCFVDDVAWDVFDKLAWVQAIHPFLLHVVNEYGTDVFIFDHLIRGEYHFLPASQMSIIPTFAEVGYLPDVDAMALYDRDGRMENYLECLRGVRGHWDTAENIQSLLGNFCNMALLGVNVLKRGEIARAYECLFLTQRYYLQMLRLLEGSTEHWLHPAKNLEHELSGAHYRLYQRTTAELDEASVRRAWRTLLSAGRDAAQDLARWHEYPAPLELIDQIADHLRHF